MSNKLLFACFALCSFLTACQTTERVQVSAPTDRQSMQKGYQLAQGLASCGFCHGLEPDPKSPLGGGQIVEDEYGELPATNITMTANGIFDWRDADIVNAIRSSINDEEEELSFDVHRGYEWMSDEDVYQIVAFLRVAERSDNEVERRELGLLSDMGRSLTEKRKQMQGYVPEISGRSEVARGKYLVDHVARCGICHNSEETLFNEEGYLNGGQSVKLSAPVRQAPDITQSKVYGIGSWSKKDIVRFLQKSVTPSGERIDPQSCPTGFYKNADKEDLAAIANYLKTVK